MVNEADSLIGKPYVYGGGHSGWGPQGGYNSSGFVSAVLHAGGYLSQPQTTQGLPDQPGIESGPGQYVTIYDRNTGPTNNEHVIIEINGQFYESGGGAGAWGGGGGVEKIGTPSQAYLSSFTTLCTPPASKRQPHQKRPRSRADLEVAVGVGPISAETLQRVVG